ncbi:hypothetical protein BS17DRAFT_63397 [Gyrodon lividus]|nr:hypothetical protein BS17DRAFT_63397 [Gyrodon lividus]
MDPSEVGCFGTLRLMKRLEPNTPVASFPIDDDTITFGRDPRCSVRLYYPSVDALHAKIIFQERKAFVIVLGSNGLYIDGCHVLPSANSAMPTTVPVSNNSEIEIHQKRFVFTYPPKELRPALYMSPSKDVPMTPGTCRKTLRMSMIQSAEVFTPRPSKNPGENLRILQSPLKQRSKSPLKQQYAPDQDDISEDENEEEIVLVDGDHPHVVEEGKDLVILESVEVEGPPSQPPQNPARVGAFGRTVPGSGMNQYQTPRRRLQARPSLHRAVLIRSAQRAITKQEIEREEVGEEKEVEEFIAEVTEGHEGDDNSDQGDDNSDQGDDSADEEEDEGEDGQDCPTQPTDQGSRWRKSIEAVKGFSWPFRSSSAPPDEVKDQEIEDQPEGEINDVEMDVDHELPPSSDSLPNSPTDLAPPIEPSARTPEPPRQWGNFMTPQVPPRMNPGVGRGAGRNSFGGVLSAAVGTGPRRVRVEPKWKVTDIVVPLPTDAADDYVVEPEIKEEENPDPALGSGRRMRISDEERKAIQERRRSALTMPDPYFSGQVPGMGARRYSNVPGASPVPLPSLLSSATRSLSPTKLQNTSPTKLTPHAEEQSGSEEEDTRSLLDRMKKTVEEMKRRRSIGSTWEAEDEQDEDEQDLDVVGTMDNVQAEEQEVLDEEGSDKENGGAEFRIDIDEAMQQPEAAPVGENEDVMAVDEEKDEDAPADLPLPALTRPSNPQTPTLKSLKHLFPQPKPSAASSTPAIKSMRHLFRSTHSDAPHTPPMDGMRGMFLREEREKQISETPIFEGVGEMMQTPSEYRQQDMANDEDTNENVSKEALHPPPQATFSKTSAAPTATTTRRRTPRTNQDDSKTTATRQPVPLLASPEEDPSAAVSAEVILPELQDKAPPTRKARLLRGRKEMPVDEPDIQEVAPVPANTEPKTSRSRKVKTESDTAATALRRPPTRSRATPITEVIPERRITRSEPVKPKSRLPAKAAQITTRSATPSEQPGQSSRSSRKVGTGTRAGTGRTTPNLATIRNVDGDESDPLDSIGQPEDAPVVRRRTRTVTAPKVKQEDAEAVPTTTRRRAATSSTPKPTAAPTTSRAKPATAKKKPTATAATKVVLDSGSESVDKENTPSREDEEPSQDPPKATKVKRGAVTLKSKEAEEVEPPKPRTTRATRGRN